MESAVIPDPSLEMSPIWFATLFRGVWTNDVPRQHELGVLNSERALQALLVGAFSSLAPEVVTLVEPQVSVPGIIPDLWIGCPATGRTLAIVEIKYVPHHYPKWEKDLASLTAILASSEGVAHDTNPVTGRNNRAMSCDERTLGVFAVVGRHDADAVNTAVLRRSLIEQGAAYGGPQRATFPRLLHAWGTVDVDQSTRAFGMNWLFPRVNGDPPEQQ